MGLPPDPGNLARPRATAVPANPDAGQIDHPIGTPAHADAHGHLYLFERHQPGSAAPVTYDRCRPIHYVVRTAGEPAGGSAAISNGIRELEETTGLRFVFDGATTEVPSEHRPAYQPARYGDRWAPVLIAWVTPQEVPRFSAHELGDGGSAEYGPAAGTRAYVTGQVRLASAKLAQDGARVMRATVLHELGHLVGLAHVSDPSQLMFPTVRSGLTDFGAGDRAGLAELGSGPCVRLSQ
ncbi:matrixin family metalloprotease [Oryzihumus leptocrescens]|uniref:matrixin family metalloprotease n=1 Tax=Oryzihumus leptocrescens TaxID=297536 RepID=UPI00163AD788|nr:matrixin family metalloprotease [Oryzihumus leptocrescens]